MSRRSGPRGANCRVTCGRAAYAPLTGGNASEPTTRADRDRHGTVTQIDTARIRRRGRASE
jgi:hypothetical protein